MITQLESSIIRIFDKKEAIVRGNGSSIDQDGHQDADSESTFGMNIEAQRRRPRHRPVLLNDARK
jgi:hypothetical protein